MRAIQKTLRDAELRFPAQRQRAGDAAIGGVNRDDVTSGGIHYHVG